MISDIDRYKIREKAKNELIRLEDHLNDLELIELLDNFKNKFNLCETVYKIVLYDHQRFKKKEIKGHLKISMTQVPYALQFAGYNFDKDLLNNLFGSKSPNGSTVKKLRDSLTHGLDERSIEEIKARKDEIFGYMNKFIQVIRNFDN